MSALPRLKLLVLTPQLPFPPEQGTSLRNFHIIRGLADYHAVSLLSFAETKTDETASINVLEKFCRSVAVVAKPQHETLKRFILLLTDRRPDMAHRLRSNAFEAVLGDVLSRERFDIVQIEGIELASYMSTIRALSPDSTLTFDDHNAEAELQRRMFLTDLASPVRWVAAAYSFIQWRRLRRFERNACRLADGVSVVSEADRNQLRNLAPGVDPYVVPNCIDVEAYKDLSHLADAAPAFDLLFIGKMDYRPNVDAVLWFGREIWPRIRAENPLLKWAVVGKNPHSRLEALARQPGVIVTGPVPDIKPYLAGAKVYVMPFRIGSGTRLKLIEALAAGVATVSTRIGAEGYPLTHGRQLLLADDPESFARAVSQLLADSEERDRLSRAGREFARMYDWRRVIPAFNDMYERLH